MIRDLPVKSVLTRNYAKLCDKGKAIVDGIKRDVTAHPNDVKLRQAWFNRFSRHWDECGQCKLGVLDDYQYWLANGVLP